MSTYSIGKHFVDRSRLTLGPNARVVTIERILKTVESITAHGCLQEGNIPSVAFNSPDGRFANIDIVRQSLDLIQEINELGTMMYHVGSHRQTTWKFLEKNPQHVP